MKREEALKFWEFCYENAKDFNDPHWEGQERREHREYVEALRMAIEALSKIVDITQRDLCADISCTDCPFMQETCKLMDYVASAEAVQGEWIENKDCEGKTRTITCSRCGYKERSWENMNFCPNCGAKMRGGDPE